MLPFLVWPHDLAIHPLIKKKKKTPVESSPEEDVVYTVVILIG